MSADKPTRKRRKGLSDEDRALWKKVTATLTPLHPAKQRFDEALNETAVEPEPLEPAPPISAKEKKKQQLNTVSLPKATQKPALPPLSPLAKRDRRRLVRGRGKTIDARIDLHGMTQHQAHDRLRGFLHHSQVSGYTLVLVITGKGTAPDASPYGDMRGVLRRVVPQWLSLPDFRNYVVGFEQAHPSHGGEGALYVRIRRRKGFGGDYS